MDQATKAQAAAGIARLQMMRVGVLSKAFYQKYGKDALPIITGVMTKGGAETGKMMQQMGVPKSMRGICEGYKNMCSMMGLQFGITELSDKSLNFKTSKCPFGIEGTTRELCESMNEADKSMMSAFLGQEVGDNLIKSLAMGDKECEVIFSVK